MAYRRAMQEETMRKGPWVEEEDERLATFVTLLGERRWDSLARASGLRRSGKSCRLRWKNYLRPDLKHGRMSMEEEQIIFQLHERWGNKWSRMARWLPGRTDNEIKNYWRTHLRKKAHAQEQENLQKGIDITAHAPQHFLPQEGAQNTQTSSFEYLGSSGKDDVVGTSKDSIDVNKLPDYAFATSPYETHLSDWISGFSDDQIATEHQEERNTLDSLFCHPTWVSENGDDTWGYCSGSLWDME